MGERRESQKRRIAPLVKREIGRINVEVRIVLPVTVSGTPHPPYPPPIELVTGSRFSECRCAHKMGTLPSALL
jgi:hypothetical protein